MMYKYKLLILFMLLVSQNIYAKDRVIIQPLPSDFLNQIEFIEEVSPDQKKQEITLDVYSLYAVGQKQAYLRIGYYDGCNNSALLNTQDGGLTWQKNYAFNMGQHENGIWRVAKDQYWLLPYHSCEAGYALPPLFSKDGIKWQENTQFKSLGSNNPEDALNRQDPNCDNGYADTSYLLFLNNQIEYLREKYYVEKEKCPNIYFDRYVYQDKKWQYFAEKKLSITQYIAKYKAQTDQFNLNNIYQPSVKNKGAWQKVQDQVWQIVAREGNAEFVGKNFVGKYVLIRTYSIKNPKTKTLIYIPLQYNVSQQNQINLIKK